MKKLITALVGLGAMLTSFGQAYPTDIGTGGLGIIPPVIGSTGTADFKFNVANFGTSPVAVIPANTVTVTLSLPSSIAGVPKYYQFQSIVSGAVGPYFNWSYDPVDNLVIGTNHTAIPRFGGDLNVTVRVIGFEQTPPAGATSVLNIEQGGGVANNPINDGGTAPLIVTTTLPITLASFDVTGLDCSNRINWKTSAEQNSRSFELEASSDGRNFRTISTTNAAGNSSNDRTYTYTDVSATVGMTYYRLKMTDIDGRVMYSGVSSVNTKCGLKSISIRPNPVVMNQQLSVQVSGYMGKNLKGELFALSGQVLRSFSLKDGVNVLAMDNLAQATYMLKITEPGGSATSFRVVVIK